MNKIVLGAIALLFLAGTLGSYFIIKEISTPDPLGQAHAPNDFGSQNQGRLPQRVQPLARPTIDVQQQPKPPVVNLSEEQRQAALSIAEKNELVEHLKQKIDVRRIFVDEKGFQLPDALMATVVYRGEVWVARISVDIGRGEVTDIHIERPREEGVRVEFGDLVSIAEKNPEVRQRLAGKRYRVQVLPSSPQGIVGVGFMEEKTGKPLFVADVDPETKEVRIKDLPQLQGFQEREEEGGIRLWQVLAISALVILIIALTYMYFSRPKKKENQ